jgi:DNA-binding transcriptional MerR regulator
MGTYRVSELARRSGFTSSAIRYYEQSGLMPSPERSSSGYRLYDDEAVARLEFVARAKRMGFSLDSISELVDAWVDGECGPVHQRLLALLSAKLDDVDSDLVELSAFRRQLGEVSRRVSAKRPPHRCRPGCGCDADIVVSEPGTDGPIACTLEAGAFDGRVRDWMALAGQATSRESIPGGLRVSFEPSPAMAARLAELCAREVECCTFFRFAVGMGSGRLWLDVRAPNDAQEAISALFGVA